MCVHLSIKFAGVHKEETSVSNITCIPRYVAIDSPALNWTMQHRLTCLLSSYSSMNFALNGNNAVWTFDTVTRLLQLLIGPKACPSHERRVSTKANRQPHAARNTA